MLKISSAFFEQDADSYLPEFLPTIPKLVLQRADNYNVPTEVCSNTDFEQGGINKLLAKYQPI